MAVEKNNTFSIHKEVTLSNEFSLSGSGLGTQTKNSDGSNAPFWRTRGSGVFANPVLDFDLPGSRF